MTRVQFSQQKTLAEAKILKKRHPAGSPLETFGPVGRPATPPQCLNRSQPVAKGPNGQFRELIEMGSISTRISINLKPVVGTTNCTTRRSRSQNRNDYAKTAPEPDVSPRELRPGR